MILRVWDELRTKDLAHAQKRVSKATEVRTYCCIDSDYRTGIRFEGIWRPQELPEFRFVQVRVAPLGNGMHELEIVLTDDQLTPLFAIVCENLISIAETKGASINSVATRLKHWKSLLDDPAYQAFSTNKVRGLVGELLVLLRISDAQGLPAAIKSWSGPMATPQDFYFDAFCVEVKTVGTGARRVKIQTVEQLDPLNDLELFLYIVMLNDALIGSEGAISISELLARIELRLRDDNDTYVDLLGRLQCLGWNREESYNETAFSLVSLKAFKVSHDFPRLRTKTIPAGISFLQYDLDLKALDGYEVVRVAELGGS